MLSFPPKLGIVFLQCTMQQRKRDKLPQVPRRLCTPRSQKRGVLTRFLKSFAARFYFDPHTNKITSVISVHPPHLTEEPILTSVEVSSPPSACQREGQRDIELIWIRRGGIQTVDSHNKNFLLSLATYFSSLPIPSRVQLLLSPFCHPFSTFIYFFNKPFYLFHCD